MKKLVLLITISITSFSFGQEELAQNTIKAILTGNQSQVIQLAEAFSEDQYNWRPSEGVNSVGEALLHVATANYFLASKMGFATPAEIDVMALGQIKGKENIIAAIKASNEFILEKIDMVPDSELNEEVDFGFMKMNKLGGLLVMMEHNGEHKGQLIAYARSNGVVPPWSK